MPDKPLSQIKKSGEFKEISILLIFSILNFEEISFPDQFEKSILFTSKSIFLIKLKILNKIIKNPYIII